MNAKTIAIAIIIALALCVSLFFYTNTVFHAGEQTGAKIATATTTIDSYRNNEVRGDCSALFNANECTKCHTIDFLQ